MAIELIVEVMNHAPADVTPAEFGVLLVIAEHADKWTRIAYERKEPWDPAKRSRLSPTGFRSTLQRLAARGLEVRVQLVTDWHPEGVFDRAGRPVYACRGRSTTYRLPRFAPLNGDASSSPSPPSKGDASSSPFGRNGDATAHNGDARSSARGPNGDASSSPRYVISPSGDPSRAHAREEPPARCPRHLDDPNPPRCGPCADARKAHERWEANKTADKARRLNEAPRCRIHPQELGHNCRTCRSERIGVADVTDQERTGSRPRARGPDDPALFERTGARRYGDPRRRKPVTGDLARLAQPTGGADPRKLGGDIAGPGGSRDRGAVFLDVTDTVLLDSTDVCTVDAVRQGAMAGQVIFMTLAGRVNKTTDRTQVGYLFGPDGAAALITELLALADRFGAELLDDVTRRLTALHQGRHVDLHFLRAAIDNAIEQGEDNHR